MDKRPTKSNRFAKVSKHDAIKQVETTMVDRSTNLILGYNQKYENQIADLKNAHLKEIGELKSKHKKAMTYALISLGIFIIVSSIMLFK